MPKARFRCTYVGHFLFLFIFFLVHTGFAKSIEDYLRPKIYATCKKSCIIRLLASWSCFLPLLISNFFLIFIGLKRQTWFKLIHIFVNKLNNYLFSLKKYNPDEDLFKLKCNPSCHSHGYTFSFVLTYFVGNKKNNYILLTIKKVVKFYRFSTQN